VRHLDSGLVEVAELASTDKTNVGIVLFLDKTERQTERSSAVSELPGQSLDKNIP